MLPPVAGGGLNSPISVAVDASGKLYVAFGETIFVFDTTHGNPELPAIGITSGLNIPDGLAIH